MTLDTLAKFGVQIETNKDFSKFMICGNSSCHSVDTTIQGGWSGASFMLVVVAIAGEVTAAGLKQDSVQSDRAILNTLELSGAKSGIDGDLLYRLIF